MIVTLDFCGFTQDVDVNRETFDSGRIEFAVCAPIMVLAGKFSMERDMEYGTLAFYRTAWSRTEIWTTRKL